MASIAAGHGNNSMDSPTARSIYRRDLFRGKVYIVTGGGTGIGKQIVQELLLLGACVAIGSRNIEKLETAGRELAGAGFNAMESQAKRLTDLGNLSVSQRLLAKELNIRKEEHVTSFVESVLSAFGRIDGLVNNGGGQFISPAESISKRGFSAVVETNLIGTFLMCKECYSQWMSEHGGSIVSIVLDLNTGFPGFAHSGASRAGVISLTQTLAAEWAPSGVRINAIAPGIIYSKSAMANYGDAADVLLPEIVKALPSNRLGTVEETSSAVVFLLSEGASYVTA